MLHDNAYAIIHKHRGDSEREDSVSSEIYFVRCERDFGLKLFT